MGSPAVYSVGSRRKPDAGLLDGAKVLNALDLLCCCEVSKQVEHPSVKSKVTRSRVRCRTAQGHNVIGVHPECALAGSWLVEAPSAYMGPFGLA